MGWFDNQIRERKLRDEEVFSDSFAHMAGAVMGNRTTLLLSESKIRVKEAIDEVLKYFNCTSSEIPEELTDPNEQLEYILRPNGIMKREVELTKGWYKDAIGPMLGYKVADDTVVAFIPQGNLGYKYYDTKADEYGKVTAANEKEFGKDAIVFYKPYPLRKMTVLDFVMYLASMINLNDIISFALATLAITLISKLLPGLTKMLFDNAESQKSLPLLGSIGVFFICVIISSKLFSTIKSMLLGRIRTKLDVSVKAATMMRVLSLPASFFKDYSAGDLSSRINYANTLNDMIVSAVIDTGFTSLCSLLYLQSVSNLAPELLKPSIVILLITAVYTAVSTLISMQQERKVMKLSSQESGLSYALISGIQKIKLSGSEKRAFAKWGDLYSTLTKIKYKLYFLGTKNAAIPVAISMLGTIVLYAGATESGMSAAAYGGFTAAFGLISGAFAGVNSIVQEAASIKPVLEMVKPIFETAPEVSKNKQIITKISGSVEYNNVTFRYADNTPNVLEDFSLKVRPGEYLGIVGKTGCGKSTLIRLLLGFEMPNSGAIYIDARDLKNVDLKSLRQHIGVVMQDGKLFQGDIYSNITISAPWLTLDEAWEAAEMACIADDIRKMPMGMNTIISEGSGGISGGQRQRLLIARAIAPKPKILVFDEATSALDNITQKKVSESLDGLKCTRLVIAHRLSTIKNCDRIICLDQGKIIEEGTYDELIAKNGFFAELVERQRVNPES